MTNFIDTANVLIFGVDSQELVNEWNQTAERITGFSKEDLMGKDLVQEFVTDDYNVRVKEVLVNALSGIDTTNYELPLFTKDGRKLMVLLNTTARRDVNGDIIGVIGVGQDITEISKYRENLERLVEERTREINQSLADADRARERIDGILKSVADGLIVTDVYNRIVLINRAAEDLLGIRFSEVMNQPIDFAIKEKTLRENIRYSLDKKTTGCQFDFNLPSGDPKHPHVMRSCTSIFYNSEGSKAGIVTIIHDVTHEREVDRMKTEFISMAAHELRTPLTSIQGFSEILLTRKNLKAEEKEKFLTYINKQSVGLVSIINDLLDISRIEAKRGFSLTKVFYNAGDVIKETIVYFEEKYKKRRFEVILPEETVELYVDKQKMGQVLKNLLDNAVKYDPDGGVIRVKGEIVTNVELESRMEYRVSVQDEGIGITPKQVEKIFDKFYRADASDAAIEGTGLGMTIVKHIVEEHGGKVWVESELGKGTTVTYAIPI